MERIKCPNCGSFAQIKLVWEDRDSYIPTKTKEYTCGCGCRFEAIFEVKKLTFQQKKIKKGLTKAKPYDIIKSQRNERK